MLNQEEQEFEARGHREDVPLSVGQLNWHIKTLLEHAIPSVWVEGEVSDLSRPSSGHLYFSLKDDQSQVRAVIWRSAAARLPFELKNGLSIVCRGAVEVYPPRGSYQLIVNKLQPQGIGPLQLAFQQLYEKLKAKGLFAEERKRPLPRFPRRIGFVTSPSGAAIHDFLESARNLWSDFSLVLIPARVQGKEGTADIVRGIQLAQRLTPGLDVLIVGRGGGSMEDLWCFNEEPVIHALANCKIPTVSAVGHEIDVTLADLVADARALTPTQAAQIVLPNGPELDSRLGQLRQRVHNSAFSLVSSRRRQLENLSERSGLSRPHELHLRRRQMVDELELRSQRLAWNLLTRKREQLASMARAVEALSPLNVLARGFSLTKLAAGGKPIASSADVEIGQAVETMLKSGRILSRVESTHEA